MIARTLQPGGSTGLMAATDAWQNFVESQRSEISPVGYVSQPAHAALAGQIAAALDETLFGQLPERVIGIIGQHDVGWAQLDLAALEDASRQLPLSFLRVPPELGIGAWERSIAEAQRVSPLAAFLIGKHFWLLAPHDDSAHRTFIEDQGAKLQRDLAEMNCTRTEADRFAAALGFCDLLSLHLCSGSSATVRIPLAHPADPQSHGTEHVAISVTEGMIHADKPKCWTARTIGVDGWLSENTPNLSSTRLEWQLG